MHGRKIEFGKLLFTAPSASIWRGQVLELEAQTHSDRCEREGEREQEKVAEVLPFRCDSPVPAGSSTACSGQQ